MSITRNARPRPISEKKLRERRANGETRIFTTISPNPLPGGPRRKAVKKRNAKRKASEFARAYGSQERVAWVKRQRCIVTGLHSSTVENVHVRGGGGSRKADACWIVPMVAHKHRELHETGKRTFEAKHSIDLDAAAEYTEKRWQRHCEEIA